MWLDLQWWLEFLPKWNGISLIHKKRAIRHVWVDAAGTKGQGAFFTDPGVDHRMVTWEQAFSRTLSRHHRHKDINFKEMHTVLLAIQRWLPLFSHDQLIVFIDNSTVFHGLQRRSVRRSAMDPLRKITLLAALHNVDIQAQWLPTHENTLADLLSRRNSSKLADLFPLLAQEPLTEIPQNLGTPILVSPALLPIISGGASAPTQDEHTAPRAEAMSPAAL